MPLRLVTPKMLRQQIERGTIQSATPIKIRIFPVGRGASTNANRDYAEAEHASSISIPLFFPFWDALFAMPAV